LAQHGELARWGLAVMATVVAVLLGRWAWKGERPLTALGLGFVAGGAIGNALDRVRIGAVVDFLDVHYAGWHWPAFNIADAGITLGVILLLVDGLFGRDPAGPEKT
jgi:signal peptidase II